MKGVVPVPAHFSSIRGDGRGDKTERFACMDGSMVFSLTTGE